MKYWMTFAADIYDFESGTEHRIITTPGDYIRMKGWAAENLPEGGDETVESLRVNYATAWHALKRLGKLDELGLPATLTLDGVDALADRFSVFMGDVEDGSLPLAEGRGR